MEQSISMYKAAEFSSRMELYRYQEGAEKIVEWSGMDRAVELSNREEQYGSSKKL
jgi:hypothetical protein